MTGGSVERVSGCLRKDLQVVEPDDLILSFDLASRREQQASDAAIVLEEELNGSLVWLRRAAFCVPFLDDACVVVDPQPVDVARGETCAGVPRQLQDVPGASAGIRPLPVEHSMRSRIENLA